MELLSNIAVGFSTALTYENLMICFIGCVLGTAIGVLPGLGPAPTIAMLLPITYTLEPTAALIMLAGIYYGSQYGGSTTSILLNLPGEASSVVSCIDGHQMAKRGRAGPALAIAAIGSFFAGTVATVLVAAFAPALIEVALVFGPAEYFSLVVLGLVCVIVLSRGALAKALAAVVIGMVLGLVGTDMSSGATRFTLGSLDLADGIEFIALAMGFFAFAEIIHNLVLPQARDVLTTKVTNLMPSRADLAEAAPAIVRGTLVGSALGILPGGGAVLASWTSYALEKRLARNPEEFGQGAIRGLAGPESANNASVQTSFIPMLTLGIPANASMALMVGAMMMHNIIPGPRVMELNPTLFWGLIASMWIGNLMLVVLNLPLVGIWVKLLRVPYEILFPTIVVVCCIGIYTVNFRLFDVYVGAALAVLAWVLAKLRFEAVPVLLGFILSPLLEDNFRRAMVLSRGDPSVFVTSWLSALLLLLSLVMILSALAPAIRTRREDVFVEE